MTLFRAPLRSNKRAVTETITYVVLVIIAFGISILLYNYLVLNAPKERPACPEGVSIAVQDASCLVKPKPSGTQSDLTITLTNNGRRTLSGAYLRLGMTDQKVKGLLNENKIFFPSTAENPKSAELQPGKSITQKYQGSIAGSVVGSYALEIEPVVGKPGNLALCESAVITRSLQCDYPKPKSVPPFTTGTIELGTSWIWPKRDSVVLYFSVKPEDSYAEAVSHLEATLKRKNLYDKTTWEDVYWFEGGSTGLAIKKVYEPDSQGSYKTETWLGRGEYELSAYLVLYTGEKIKVQDSRPGYSRFPFDFVVYRNLDCQKDERGWVTYISATTSAIYDESIREKMIDSCSGSTFIDHHCSYQESNRYSSSYSSVVAYHRSCAKCAPPSSDGVGRCEGGSSDPYYVQFYN